MTKTLTPVTSAACWQAYRATTGTTGGSFLGLGEILGTSGFTTLLPTTVSVVPALTTAVPFAAAASTAAATAHVMAVAGAHQVATAPKQADKPNAMRNDVNPLGSRPGAPPG